MPMLPSLDDALIALTATLKFLEKELKKKMLMTVRRQDKREGRTCTTCSHMLKNLCFFACLDTT